VKTKNILLLLLLVFAVAMVGCEGDEGPAGPTGPAGDPGDPGEDGTPGDITNCTACHASAEFEEIQAQYSYSGHALGAYVGYAGGRASCTPCHSSEQFVQWAELGEVDDAISSPSAIGCRTCHNVHETFLPADYALRVTGTVDMLFDETYELDFGDSSNLCAICHQSRRAEPNTSNPGETFDITSTHYGPHHGAQANVLEGVGFAEIVGSVDYPASSGHLNVSYTCVTCHMGDYDGEEAAGGHTWGVNYNSCSNCHTQDAIDTAMGAIEVKLDALRDRLVELGVVEWVEEDEAYEPIVGTYPMAQAQAFFNWIGLVEDRSMGAHNPSYVEALIDNSLEAIAD